MSNPPIRQTIMQAQAMASTPDNTEVALVTRPIESQIDFAGREPMNTIFGEKTVGLREDSVSIIFQYGLSDRDVSQSTSGSGVISHANQMANVSVNSGTGAAIMKSVDPNRYRAGHEMVSQFTGVFEGRQAGCNQYVGPLNESDGACFGTSSGQMGCWFIQNSAATFYPQNSWSANVCSWINPAMMNIYMVSYGFLGIAPIQYSVFDPYKKKWTLAHEVNLVNEQASPHLGNPSIPMGAKVEKSIAGTLVASVKTASWRSGCIGGAEEEANSANRWFAWTKLDASISANSGNNVFTLRVNSTFGGMGNHVVCELGVATFVNATNKTVAWYGTKNATVTSGSAWTPVQSGSSVMDVSEGGYVTGGRRGPATVTGANADRRTEVLGTGILIYPGETFTFEAVAGAGVSGTVSLSARWIERF